MGVVYSVVLLHIIDYCHHFMFDWMDWILYVFTIIVLSVVSFWKLKDYAETVANAKVRQCFKFILAAESILFVMELFRDYIIFFVNIWHIVEIIKLIFTFMILPAQIIKYVKEDAENNNHIEIVRSMKKHLKITRYFLVAIITLAIIYYIKPEYTFLITLLVFAFLGRRIYILMSICAAGNYQIIYYEEDDDDVTHNDVENTEIVTHSKVNLFVKKLFKTLGVAVISVVIIAGIASNYYVKDYEIEYGYNGYGDWNEDNIESYKEHYSYCEYKNLMPYWTRLDKSYGNIVDSDGIVKASHIKYSIYVADDYGILPDGKGHIIDVTGEYQYDLPYLCNAKISQRTLVYRSFLSYLKNLNKRTYRRYIDTTYKCFYYDEYGPDDVTVVDTNEDGAVIFYSLVRGKYGVCDKNGVVLKPKYESLESRGRIYRSKHSFYDKNGKELLMNYHQSIFGWEKVNDDCEMFILSYQPEGDNEYSFSDEKIVIIDYDGNVIEDDIDYLINNCKDGIEFEKDGTNYFVGADHVVVNADKYGIIKHISLSDLYDYEDDESLKNGMWARVDDANAEKEFLSYFFDDAADMKVIETSTSKVYLGQEDGENIFVFIVNDEYGNDAYGFRYSLNDAVIEGKYDKTKNGDELFDYMYSLDGEKYFYTDALKPLLDYQEKNYVKDEDGSIVKVEYDSDAYEYGTYNSSGELYFDDKERPLYRLYYVTSGSRFCYYLYNDNDELVQIFDFGGMPYKGLEENPEIAIGVDLSTYIFER